jgi:hypothetical protein
MTWRRLMLPAILLLIVISALSATSSRNTGRNGAPTTPPQPPPAAAPTVTATLPRDAPLRASVGDVVRLVVKARADDTVTVDALGLEAPVGETVPAELVFVADRPGRFRVSLRDAGESVGTLVVAA